MKNTGIGRFTKDADCQKRHHVLMVIDEPECLEHHSGVLRALGYEVLACGSYDEALAMLQSDVFDFVTVGQGGTAFEGKGVVARTLEIDRSTPVLVLARTLDIENYLEAMQMGAVDYLEMPVPPEEFMRVLRTHLLYSIGGRTDS